MGPMARGQAQDLVGAQQAPVRTRDLLALLGANAALAVGPWFVRMTEVGPVSSAFWRMSLALPVLFILAWRFGGGIRVERRHLGWLAFAGLFFAVDIASWHFGILATKLANATLLGNAASLLFPIWGFLVLRAWPSRMQGVALVLAMAGAALLMGRSYQLSTQYFVGDLLCLTAGICYTVYLVGIDRVRGTVPPWSVLVFSTGASAIPLLIAAIAFGERIWPSNWMPLIGIAFMSQIVGQGLLVLVLGRLSPMLIGLAFLTQPFIAALIGWYAYDERLATADWIGAALVALALVLVRQPGGVSK
jgi:drug/metabolite transporter (DMT)-like permease